MTRALGSVLVVGASSPIARACAEQFASRGHPILAAGRDGVEMQRIAADLRVRFGVPADSFVLDVLEPYDPDAPLQRARTLGDALAGVLVAVGVLGDESRAQADPSHAEWIRRANYTALLPLLDAAAHALEHQGRGFIIGIGSVAGDRLRKSNYTYGSAKAELAGRLDQLRARLRPAGVQVLTVKPGFVDTAMIWAEARPLTARPERVASDILDALDDGRELLYSPWFWQWIMLIIRAVPGPIFRRLPI